MNLKTLNYVNRISNIFGDSYDYSLITNIKNQHQKVSILCKIHNEIFTSSVCHLLEGHGCPKCKNEKLSKTKRKSIDLFKQQLINKFGDIYEILSDYINNHIKVKLKCKKCGLTFERSPKHILNGVGCLNCYSSKLELKVSKLLFENNISFESQKHFKWLDKKSLDFYLPNYNIGIECLGLLHFIEKDFFGGKIGLEEIQSRDKEKYNLCLQNNIKLVYFSDLIYNFPYSVITSETKLLNEIFKS